MDLDPLALWLYSSVQYSVHRFSISRSSVRHFPERSWTVVAFPYFTVVKPFTSWYAFFCCSSSDFLLSRYTVLLSSFLLPFSCISWCFVHFLIFLRSFRFNFVLSQVSPFVAQIKNFCNDPGIFSFLLTMFATDLTGCYITSTVISTITNRALSTRLYTSPMQPYLPDFIHH